MDTSEAIKQGRLDEALGTVKDAVRKAPSDPGHRSVLFQLYCVQGNWEGAQTQLKLVGEFDMEAVMWVGVCEKVLACEAERRAVFEGKNPPTLFGKPPEWVGGMVEALRLGVEGKWEPAAASQAKALEAAPAVAIKVNGQEAAWLVDGDSRFGPLIEAFVDGKYYWIPAEHVREITFRPRTHLMDSIWAPADFRWLNEGQASGYLPVRYPDSEKSTDPQIQLARQTQWQERAENFYSGLGHRTFMTDAAEFPLAEIKSIQFLHPEAPVVAEPASELAAESGEAPSVAPAVTTE